MSAEKDGYVPAETRVRAMVRDGNYPSAFEREKLVMQQFDDYQRRTVINLLAMLDHLRRHKCAPAYGDQLGPGLDVNFEDAQ